MNFELVFILLIVYQLKHFLADYPLQGQYMLRKFSPVPSVWIPALAAHAGVHASFTYVIAFVFTRSPSFSISVAFLDFLVHFGMDRIKASPHLLGRYKSLSANEYAIYSKIASSKSEHHNAVMACKTYIDGNKYFWWSLGLDQMVHHLTHYYIIYLIVHYMVTHGR